MLERPIISLYINTVLILWIGIVANGQSTPATTDVGWPRQIVRSGNTLVYYQPQIDEWNDYKEIKARLAFSLTPKNSNELHGVVSFKCGTVVDKDEHTVYIRDLVYEDVRFPSLSSDKTQRMIALFKDLAPDGGDPVSVERIIACLDHSKPGAKAVALNNDPPPIFYSESPSILLIVDGDPVLAPIEKLDVDFIVNTNWIYSLIKSKRIITCLLIVAG